MSVVEQAVAICRGAEKAMRELMQGAIGAGEYKDLPALARVAEQLSQMAGRLGQGPEAAGVEAAQAVPRKGEARVKQADQPRLGPRARRLEYPKFRREGDTLVKIGWSKSARAEYQHRAPRAAAAALLKAIAGLAARKPVFTVDALLPLVPAGDNIEIPGYQVYLALAWLRKEGIVRQHGREGYSLLVKGDLEKLMGERWNALPGGAARRSAPY